MFKDRSIKISHPLNSSSKWAYRKRIPLSEELRKEKLAGSSSSKYDYLSVESLIKLVKSEIHLQINKLNLSQNFVKKSEIDALRNFLLSGKEIDFVSPIRKSISEDANNNSESEISTNKDDITKSGETTLNLLEQAFIAETATASSESGTEFQAMAYNQDEANEQDRISKGIICSSRDKSFCSEQESNNLEAYVTMKNIDDRLSSVEFKVNSLYKLVEKMATLKKQHIRLQKISCKRNTPSKLNLNQTQAEKQHAIIAKINAVEQNMQKVFFESNAVQKILFDSTKNPYDEKYYEWRQRRRNMLAYKKSLRSISLNRKPKIEEFHPPIAIIKTLANKKMKAHFLSTPSRTDTEV